MFRQNYLNNIILIIIFFSTIYSINAQLFYDNLANC